MGQTSSVLPMDVPHLLCSSQTLNEEWIRYAPIY